MNESIDFEAYQSQAQITFSGGRADSSQANFVSILPQNADIGKSGMLTKQASLEFELSKYNTNMTARDVTLNS